jgi:hypothetical protein
MVAELVNKADSQDEIHISKTRQERKQKLPRSYYRVNGSNGPHWDMPNNDIDSVSHAILERVFFVKDGKNFKRAPKPRDAPRHAHLDEPLDRDRSARAHVADTNATFCSKMERLATTHGKVSPVSDQEFLDCYGGAKRACYEAAVESLEDTPLETRDCRVKVFTKDEYRKPGGAPRAIQPRSPRYNVKLGRYIKNLEHTIFNAIDEIFDPSGDHKTVAKGMNMNKRGAEIAHMWGQYEDPVAVGLDASRFDQHINLSLLGIEHSIYHMWSTGKGEGLPNLETLLKHQRLNRGKYKGVDGIIKYVVEGCRMSGDMNTSLGNVIIMCCLMYSFFESKKLLGKISLLNDGDDCVIIMDRRNLDKFRDGLEEWFLEMGITMCYDGVYNTLEDIEFCQSHPVFDEEVGYRLVPRPTKRLYSDLISTKPLGSKKVYRKWLGAVAGCGLAMSTGLPIFSNFYQWVGKGATPYIPAYGDVYYKFRQELVSGMDFRVRSPSNRERISFYHAFNITPSEQMLVEKYYANLPDPVHTLPQVVPSLGLNSIQYLVQPEQKDRKLN